MPYNAFIVEAVRTPAGRRNGKLSKWHPADLGAVVVDELVKRTGVPGEAVRVCVCELCVDTVQR